MYDTAEKCFGYLWRTSRVQPFCNLDATDYFFNRGIFSVLCEYFARGGTMRDIILKFGINVYEFYERLEKTPEARKEWQKTMVRREETLREASISTHMRVVDASIKDLYDESGVIRSISDLPDHVADAIKKVSYWENGQIKNIEMYCKQKSADSLRKSLLIEKNASPGDELSYMDLLRKAEERAAKQRDKRERVISVDSKAKGE